MFSFARSVPCYGWLRQPSRLKMNWLRSALTAAAASHELPDIQAKENIRYGLTQTSNNLTRPAFSWKPNARFQPRFYLLLRIPSNSPIRKQPLLRVNYLLAGNVSAEDGEAASRYSTEHLWGKHRSKRTKSGTSLRSPREDGCLTPPRWPRSKLVSPVEQKMPLAIQKGLDGLHEDVKGLRSELAASEPLRALYAASQTPNPDSNSNAPSRHRVLENVSSLDCADCRSAKWTRLVPGAIPLDLAVRIDQEVLRCTISRAVLVILVGILCTGLSCYSMQHRATGCVSISE